MEEEEKLFFEQLYRSYIKLMLAQAARCTDSREDAEDVVQASLEKLLGKYGVLTTLNEKALATYIVYTVRKRERRRAQWESPEEAAAPGPSAEELVLSAIGQEELFAAWRQLPPEDRMLLAEKYFLELSVEELARLYGCSLGNVRVKLYRARRKLKKLLSFSRGE